MDARSSSRLCSASAWLCAAQLCSVLPRLARSQHAPAAHLECGTEQSSERAMRAKERPQQPERWRDGCALGEASSARDDRSQVATERAKAAAAETVATPVSAVAGDNSSSSSGTPLASLARPSLLSLLASPPASSYSWRPCRTLVTTSAVVLTSRSRAP